MPTGNNNGATPIEPGDWELALVPSVKKCLCCKGLILGGLYGYQTQRSQGRNHLCFDCWNQYDLLWPVPLYGLPRWKDPRDAVGLCNVADIVTCP
jgi:hypothetical protein